MQRTVWRTGEHPSSLVLEDHRCGVERRVARSQAGERLLEQVGRVERAASGGLGLGQQTEVLGMRGHRSGARLGSIGSKGNRAESSWSRAAEADS